MLGKITSSRKVVPIIPHLRDRGIKTGPKENERLSGRQITVSWLRFSARTPQILRKDRVFRPKSAPSSLLAYALQIFLTISNGGVYEPRNLSSSCRGDDP